MQDSFERYTKTCLDTDGTSTTTTPTSSAIHHCVILIQWLDSTYLRACEDWILAMQEELEQFERNKVWELVKRPDHSNVIGTKWVFRNKMDEHGVVQKFNIVNKTPRARIQ